jgi:hypothetical protein
MQAYKPWCWEAAQRGEGPDWQFVARVTPGSASALVHVALQTSLSGYAYFAAEPDYCEQHQTLCTYHSFVDTPNLDVYMKNLQEEKRKNVWIYNLIRIHRDTIEIECGYGGRGQTHNMRETAFLLDIFGGPDITMQFWSVLAGGNGYEYKLLASGVTLQDLVNYISPSNT